MAKIMEIISKETGGKSYNTEKYSYDTIGMPSFDYDDDGEKFIKWQVSGETEKHKTYVDLTNEAKRQIGKRPVISYFLDGSRHTYKVDDISYNKKVYPVIAGQVGIGCCKRTDGRMRPEKFYRRLVLSLPTVSNADGWKDDVFFAAQTKKLNKSEELKKLGIEFATILPYSPPKDQKNGKMEDSGIARIQDYMIESEKEMVAELVKAGKRYENASYLGDVKFGVWYIRIRDKKYTRTPFDGVIKVEKIMMDEEKDTGIDSEEIDLISATLINERTPTCYGTDKRWANHLYPVFLTESYVKSQYMSTEMFLHLF